MQEPANSWQACHPGDVHRVVTRLRNRRVRRALRRDCAIGSVLMMFVLSSYVGVEAWANQPTDIGGIMCFEMSKIRDVIVRGGTLPPETASSVRRHLAMCTHCRERLEFARTQFQHGGRPQLLHNNGPAGEKNVAEGPHHSPILSTVAY